MEDMTEKKKEVEALNSVQREAFLAKPISDRVLFLSHCINKPKRAAIKEYAEDLGYKVYIVGGGSIVKKRIVAEKPGAVVGIACFDEIQMASEKLAIPYQVVLLDRDGCENTDFDMETAREVLSGEEST
jgi:hypothetical protein